MTQDLFRTPCNAPSVAASEARPSGLIERWALQRLPRRIAESLQSCDFATTPIRLVDSSLRNRKERCPAAVCESVCGSNTPSYVESPWQSARPSHLAHPTPFESNVRNEAGFDSRLPVRFHPQGRDDDTPRSHQSFGILAGSRVGPSVTGRQSTQISCRSLGSSSAKHQTELPTARIQYLTRVQLLHSSVARNRRRSMLTIP